MLNPGTAVFSASSVNWVDGYKGTGNWVTGNNAYGGNGTGYPVWNGVDPTGTTLLFTYNYDGVQTLNSNQVAVAIDPLAITAPGGGYGARFPYHAPVPTGGGPLPSPLGRIVPFTPSAPTANPQYATQVFDSIFRSSVDLITRANTVNNELPPVQFYLNNGGTTLRRGSDGSYSWLATVVADPTATATPSQGLSADVTVSIVVFYKRDLSLPGAGEYIATNHSFPGNNEILLTTANIVSNTIPAQPIKPVQPGQWIMVAGTINGNNYYRWYKVISAGPQQNGNQQLTVHGQNWPTD